MSNTDGPAALRAMAADSLSRGEPLTAEFQRDLAADWQALAEQAASDRAALATAQHANDAERGEWSEYYALLTGDRGAWSPDDMRSAIKAQANALAQARALAEEWITGDGETYGAKLLAEAGRRLKSMLGGAR